MQSYSSNLQPVLNFSIDDRPLHSWGTGLALKEKWLSKCHIYPAAKTRPGNHDTGHRSCASNCAEIIAKSAEVDF